MSALAWTSIAVGCFIIATRGPLLVAPQATSEFLRRLVERPQRLRVLGLVVATLGLLVVWGSSGGDGTLAIVLTWLGWITIVGVTGLLVIFPGFYKSMVIGFLDAMSDVARGLGAIGVTIGIVFVWVGVTLD